MSLSLNNQKNTMSKKIAWKHKETNEWLVVNKKDTHTGAKISCSFTRNINEATTGPVNLIDHRSIRQKLEPVEVFVTTRIHECYRPKNN